MEIDEEVYGKPITFDTRTVQPVARLRGRRNVFDNGRGAWAWVRLTPVAVQVREGDGHSYRVAIYDGNQRIVLGMLVAAFVVAAVCWFIIRVRHRRRVRATDDADAA